MVLGIGKEKSEKQLDFLEPMGAESAGRRELPFDAGEAEAVLQEVKAYVNGAFAAPGRARSGDEMLVSTSTYIHALRSAAERVGLELDESDYEKAIRTYLSIASSKLISEQLSERLQEPLSPRQAAFFFRRSSTY